NNHERNALKCILVGREIQFRHWLLAKFQTANICNDTNDFEPINLIAFGAAKCDSLTYRVLTWKVLFGQNLVNDHYLLRRRIVAICKSTSLQNRDTHRSKIIGCDIAIIGYRPLIRCGDWPPFNSEP